MLLSKNFFGTKLKEANNIEQNSANYSKLLMTPRLKAKLTKIEAWRKQIKQRGEIKWTARKVLVCRYKEIQIWPTLP